MQTAQTPDRNTTIEALNSFLRGEISAVETYRQALEKMERPTYGEQLAECQRSHEYRAALLRQRILDLGGSPAESSGAWGSFAKLVQGGANLLGEKTAIASLEEGEDHGRDDYNRDLAKVDVQTKAFVESRIMPDQYRTHALIRDLKQSLSRA